MAINIGIINWYKELKWYQNILMNTFLPIWYNRQKSELNIYLIPIAILLLICYNCL